MSKIYGTHTFKMALLLNMTNRKCSAGVANQMPSFTTDTK